MTTNIRFIDEGHRRDYLACRVEAFADRCRDAGLSVTPQRRAIIQALLQTDQHPRAEDIYDTVRVDHPTMSLATVHRTLETLCRVGEARKVTTLHDSARYDGNVEPHHHLVCIECRKIVDVEVPEFEKLLEGRRSLGEFKILGCSVEIHVLCKTCREEHHQGD